MKHALITAALLLLPLWGASGADARPNIVYIVVDNVTFEHLGKIYGGKNSTPAMDSIAAGGVCFRRMYVPTPLCVPSRYSILTGRYPERSTSPGFLESNPAEESWYEVAQVELEPARPNLPKALRAAGYRTGYVGKYHLLHGKPGPEIKVAPGTPIGDPELTRLMRERNDGLVVHIKSCGFDWVGAAEWGLGFGQIGDPDTDGVHHNLEWEIESALAFLDLNKGNKEPFFLYLATRMYHLPFNIEKDLLSDYQTAGRYSDRGLLDKAPVVPMPPRKEIAALAGKDARMDAAAMLYLDFGVKAVLDRIEKIGARDNTLVVLISDNNQPGKSTVYEAGINVPAAMMWPKGIAAGQVNSRIVSSLDIAATLMAAAGAEEPEGMGLEGRSFLPMITGQPDQPWEDVFMAEYAYGRALVTPRWKYVAVRYPEERWEQIRAEDARKPEFPDLGGNVRKGEKWKKRVGPNLHPNQIPDAYNIYRYWHSGDNNHMGRVQNYPYIFDPDQLYDLETDPGEQKNLAGDPGLASKLDELRALLAREIKKMDRPFGEFKPGSPATPTSKKRARLDRPVAEE